MEAGDVVAFAPYASLAPGELLIVPTLHAASFATASATTLHNLAHSLRTLLRAARLAYGDPDYNLVLHTAPASAMQDPALHWYWQLIPRLTRIAGFELGSGVLVNTSDPDEAADLLRGSTSRGS
jgi:UDPglucose--hexose-1-phosphate uridylyltransferase